MTTIRKDAYSGSHQPRALILTVYGLYAREHDGWFSVATLIRLLADLAVDAPAVRSAVSRLKRRGILEARRIDGVAGYGLSDSARRILDEGDRRIFQRQRADSHAGWVLAVFSVPEAERTRRHLLRTRLTRLGFGTVSAGVWVAPAHLEDETIAALRRDDLEPYVDLFRAQPVMAEATAAAVATWWDLSALQAGYDAFLAAYRPVLATWRRRRTIDPTAAFTDHTAAVTAWRRLPFLDPGLPGDLLPPDWHGTKAADLFFALHDLLADAAGRHVGSVEAPN